MIVDAVTSYDLGNKVLINDGPDSEMVDMSIQVDPPKVYTSHAQTDTNYLIRTTTKTIATQYINRSKSVSTQTTANFSCQQCDREAENRRQM